ncbi:RagB/SusD family nutrient uptake outer membrane protein [Compostibacter hankyongensis]|uniref:RagB/SusD family nutrient uptake outer membrane protein n=1 Tax=Compostibacter hankyongensis TaxID=1007089 RepID=A0ABP8G4E8_9BACT
MKQVILNIALCTVLIICFSSCKNYLDEIPKDRISESTYYNNLESAQGAINAIYSPIRKGGLNGPYFLQMDIKADYGYGRGSTAPIGEYKTLDQVNIARTDGLWADFYRSINYANIAIEKIPQITTIDEDTRNALVAEAKFMRAFCYYHLVINWGAVPLYLDTRHEDTKRAAVKDVYDAIVADLTEGENSLPSTPAQFGHPTKWAAKAFLAQIYLTLGQWDDAQKKALEVIQSKAFSLVGVSKPEDFDNVFGASANGTSEEIFYLKFNHQDGWGWPLNLLWTATQFAPFGNYVIYETPDNPFIRNWNDNDLRKQYDLFTEYIDPATGKVTPLPSSTPVLCSKFRDPGATGITGFGNDYPFLRYADVLTLYAEADAMAENGPSALAIECLNKVKRRGYGYPFDVASPVDYPSTGWTAESFRDTVLQERGYEHFMEGKRWEDLRRTKKAASVILHAKGIAVQQSAYLWPIPQQEIDTNPALSPDDQNPGY